jgi:hypothetical protein
MEPVVRVVDRDKVSRGVVPDEEAIEPEDQVDDSAAAS